MAGRGADHLRDSERGMRKRFDGSHMARHALEIHPGEEPKFGMTIVRTYNNAFTRAMGEVVRILYRSKEKEVVLLNSKGLCELLLAPTFWPQLGGRDAS